MRKSRRWTPLRRPAGGVPFQAGEPVQRRLGRLGFVTALVVVVAGGLVVGLAARRRRGRRIGRRRLLGVAVRPRVVVALVVSTRGLERVVRRLRAAPAGAANAEVPLVSP